MGYSTLMTSLHDAAMPSKDSLVADRVAQREVEMNRGGGVGIVGVIVIVVVILILVGVIRL
jgi:hypothetical protein